MPFVSNMPDNEDEKTNQPNGVQGPVSPTGGGGGAVHLAPSSAVPTVGGGSGPVGKGPTAGGSFASLDKYLAANQGQADPLSGKITTGIGQQYNALQNQNTSTLNDINSQVAANATPQNYSDILSQEAANPVSFANDTGNVGKFQGLLNATYSGPASAESTDSFTKQQTAVNNAISAGNAATGTEAGRENLLSQNEATPTTGVTALNSAILSQSPTALKNVESAYQPFSNLLTGLSSGAGDINKQIATNTKNANAANTTANQQISDQTGKLQTGVQSKLDAAQSATNAFNKDAQQYDTTIGGITSNLAPLEAVLGTQFAPAYTFPGAAPVVNTPTANTVASKDDLAMQQALNNLGGQNLNLIDPNTAVGGYAAPGQAPNINNILGQLAKPLLTSVQQKSDSLTPLAATAPADYTQQYQKLMDLFSGASKYLNQYDPTNYRAVPGSPDNYWVYPS